MRRVLRLAFLYVLALNSLFFAYCLPFATLVAFVTLTFHVWHFAKECCLSQVLRHIAKTSLQQKFQIQAL